MSPVALLQGGTIALWYARVPKARLSQPTSSFQPELDCLNEAEAKRASRYLFAEPRNRFIMARCLLRQLLGHYTGLPADRLDIQLTDNEKPYLASEPRLEFNVSHSRELIAIALAWGQSVGVDVEEIDDKRDWPLIARHQFHADEQSWLASQPADQQPQCFYTIWTAKEAYLKGLGVGLGHPLNGFAVVPEANGCSPRPELDSQRCWRVRHAQLYNDYAVAVASVGEPQMLCNRLDESLMTFNNAGNSGGLTM